jgi:hypothetical protein
VGRANIDLYVQIMFDSSVPVYTISVILSWCCNLLCCDFL